MAKIKSIGVLQAAKLSAIFYFLLSALFAIPVAVIGGIMALVSGKAKDFGVVFVIFIPFIYAVFGFIFVAFSSWIYNIVASKVGGIEIDIE